jgi:hypothetical protein
MTPLTPKKLISRNRKQTLCKCHVTFSMTCLLQASCVFLTILITAACSRLWHCNQRRCSLPLCYVPRRLLRCAGMICYSQSRYSITSFGLPSSVLEKRSSRRNFKTPKFHVFRTFATLNQKLVRNSQNQINHFDKQSNWIEA